MQRPRHSVNAQEGSPVADVLRQGRQVWVFALILTAVVNVASIAPLLYMLSVYDRVIISRSLPTLISLLLITIVILVFWQALEWIRARMLVRLSLRIDWGLSPRVFDAIFRHSVTRQKVNAHESLNHVLRLRQFLTGGPILAFMDAPYALLFLAVAGMFHIAIAVFGLVVVLLLGLVTYAMQSRTTPMLRAANTSSAEATRAAAFNLRHSETAYALGMQSAVRKRWYERHREFLGQHVYASEAGGIGRAASGFLNEFVFVGALTVGAYLVLQDQMTAGMMIVSVLLLRKSVAPMVRVLATWPEITAARQSYDQLNTILLAEHVTGIERLKLPAPVGRLDVMDAAAVPPGATEPVVWGINFTVEPGQTVAVVGPSGTGKTCLTKLLSGIWKPARGSVRLDGVEISDWNHDELGALIGYVPQEIELFEGTIAENIARLGLVNSEMVVEAAKLIGSHEMILALPKGYETVVGEAGHALSSGQRQRIAIARALYGVPRYLVMDEPNSNLDNDGEEAFTKAIEQLKQQGSTVILTTHRPQAIGVADYVLVLRRGTQVHYDSKESLLREMRD